MLRHCRKVLALVLFITSTVFANDTAIRIDDFDRANNTDIGAAWDAGYTGFTNAQIVGNRLRIVTVGTYATESYNAVSFPDDQWGRITIASKAATNNLSSDILLRMAAPATITYYACEGVSNKTGSFTTVIFKQVSGSFTSIASENATTWGAGDKLTCTAVGTAIEAKYNGTAVVSTTDGDIAGGRVGFAMNVPSGGATSDLELDYWIGGEFTTCDVRVLDTSNSDKRVIDTENAIIRVTDSCTSAAPSVFPMSKTKRYELLYQEP